MTLVAIDDATLETLLHATGVVKAMESALVAAEKDPLRQKALPKVASAVEAANTALLRARRREQFPERYTPASEIERCQIETLARQIAADGPRAETIGTAVPVMGLPARIGICRALQIRGFVELGAYRESVIWSGGDITSADNPMVQHVRLTQRGRDAIREEPKVDR